MRFQRVEDEGQSFYHCVSRVVDPQFIFQTPRESLKLYPRRETLVRARPRPLSDAKAEARYAHSTVLCVPSSGSVVRTPPAARTIATERPLGPEPMTVAVSMGTNFKDSCYRLFESDTVAQYISFSLLTNHLSPLTSHLPRRSSRLSGSPSSVDQQGCAGGKFRCVGSEVKNGSRDFFAGAKPTDGMQR
jgi:hypothetical protein